MFIDQRPGSFEFYDQSSINKQICEIFADYRAVLVVNFKRMLLFYLKAKFAKPMGQGIFINLLHVPIRMINVNVISRLPHNIT